MAKRETGRDFCGVEGLHLPPAELRQLEDGGYDFARGRRAGEEIDRLLKKRKKALIAAMVEAGYLP